ncbi:four helix bundle protein [Robertkochia aurantiaca]|uniref:four helix bundle protein n=1 Tax=Robertkochia aurantiaca TaxID=2873700 RepID=UPI001CCC8542|nr:four helix bundle protein [Robertkochia sp. 3YJGBD-33]
MTNHKDLDIWKLSIRLVIAVYKLADILPPPDQYELTGKIKDAVTEIPFNIALGAKQATDRKQYIRYLEISSGYLYVLEQQLMILIELGLKTPQTIIDEELTELKLRIYNLRRSIKYDLLPERKVIN